MAAPTCLAPRFFSMMEQSHSGKGHDDTVAVALFDDQIVPNGAAGLGDVANAGGLGPLDVVREGEEGVGTQSHPVETGKERFFVFLGQPLRLPGEVILPDALGAHVLFVAVDVAVDDVVPAGTTQIRKGRFRVLGCWRRKKVSALEPASRVQ